MADLRDRLREVAIKHLTQEETSAKPMLAEMNDLFEREFPEAKARIDIPASTDE
jgi:hypothetical protein